MCQNPLFDDMTIKSGWKKQEEKETSCVNGYKIFSKIPCAACRAQTLRVQPFPACISMMIKQMPPRSCDGRHALAF